MKLFLASFAIVTAVSFALAASGLVSTSECCEATGYERTLASSPIDATNQLQYFSNDYSICDSYCKLANDQLLAIKAGANYSVTYVYVSTDTTLTPIIGITH